MPENPCEELKELSVRHLLTMTAGQQRPLLMGDSRKTLKETDWTSYVLSVPFSDHPGRVFMYSNTGPYLISRIIEEKTRRQPDRLSDAASVRTAGYSPP